MAEAYIPAPLDVPLRIGLVSFLNMFPYFCGLSERAPHWEVIQAPPSQLSKLMAAGECDIAMIPVRDYLENRGRYGHLRKSCIGAYGPTASVLIVSDVPISEAEYIQLDSNSRTSNALARILLCKPLGRPDIKWLAPMPQEDKPVLGNGTASVLIGDRALRYRNQFAHSYDLAEEWLKWQGLPFVFAVWATQNDGPWREVDDFLWNLCQENLQSIEIKLSAHPNVVPHGVSMDKAAYYLRQNIQYRLAGEQLQAIELFDQNLRQIQPFD